MGKESEREWMYVCYNWITFMHSRNYDSTVNQLYFTKILKMGEESFLSLSFFFCFFVLVWFVVVVILTYLNITAWQDNLFSRTYYSVRNNPATFFNFANWVYLCKTCRLNSEYILEYWVGVWQNWIFRFLDNFVQTLPKELST